MPYEITQCYLPPDWSAHKLFGMTSQIVTSQSTGRLAWWPQIVQNMKLIFKTVLQRSCLTYAL